MHHSSVSWEITLPYYFSRNLTWFGQNSEAKLEEKKICCFISEIIRFWRILIRAIKSLNNLHFDWSLSCKVCNVWRKKYRGVIFYDTEVSCKIWRKTNLWFGKWHEEFGKFSAEHLEVSKLGLWWDPFVQNRKCMSLKIT